MEPKETKPPQAASDVQPTMREMMERMCGTEGCDPFEMCRRMMASMSPRTGSAAKPAAGGGAPADENARSAEDEGQRPCCGPRSRCAPG
jgi:hypothetical protein